MSEAPKAADSKKDAPSGWVDTTLAALDEKTLDRVAQDRGLEVSTVRALKEKRKTKEQIGAHELLALRNVADAADKLFPGRAEGPFKPSHVG